MPPATVAYCTVKGAILVKKLFGSKTNITLTEFNELQFHGEYEVKFISDEYYHLTIGKYTLQLEGKGIAANNLLEDGFLIACDSFKKIVIERNNL